MTVVEYYKEMLDNYEKSACAVKVKQFYLDNVEWSTWTYENIPADRRLSAAKNLRQLAKNVNEDGQQANNQQQLSPSTKEQVAEVGQPYYMSYNHADSDQDIQLDQDLLSYVDDDDAGEGPSYMPPPKRSDISARLKFSSNDAACDVNTIGVKNEPTNKSFGSF
ncbi:hypothetical protein EDC96DRAFT_549837 [Choanephora cucurbitarum]|nr:hypothetical protein EDC96DRAFT_549837 [Choanephora cucurbitarum]